MVKERGFTLIELLIVVAIIAILAAIAVPNFLEAQVRSKVARCHADIRSIATGLESYLVDENHYPPCWTFDGNVPAPGGAQVASGFPNWIWGWEMRLRPITTPISYMMAIPDDPFFMSSTFYKELAMNEEAWGVVDVWYPLMKTYTYAEDYYGYYNPAFDPLGLIDTQGIDVTWMLGSLGPDKDLNYRNATSLVTIYDATNGTISVGDVQRWGGAGGRGNGRGKVFN